MQLQVRLQGAMYLFQELCFGKNCANPFKDDTRADDEEEDDDALGT